MKCPNCSKEIRDGATFCGFCGKPVAQSARAASAVPPARSAQSGAPFRQTAPPQTMPRPPVQAAPKKKRTGLIVAVCILAFLLVAGGVFALLIHQEIIEIDSDSFLSFLLPKDGGRDEDGGDEEEENSSGSRKKKDKDDEDEDNEDEDDGDEDDPRAGSSRDKDDPGRAPAGTGTVVEDAPEEPSRPLNSYWFSDVAVCVEDPEMLWPDTKSKPFEDAAERLYEWERSYSPTTLSLLVVTVDDAGGDVAAYTDDYVWSFRADHTELGALLKEIIVITFDAGRQSWYMARYTDTAHAYVLADGLSDRVASYLSIGDYEKAAFDLLRSAEEAEENGAAADSEYLLPTSDTEYLTKDDLRDLTWEECCFARNEIYARHGRIFSTPAIRAYFEGKSWYSGAIAGATFDANVSAYLSTLERANVNLIAEYERETWGGSFY